MITSWPGAGAIRPKWTLKPCAKSTAAPGSRFGAISVVEDALLDLVGQQDRDDLGAAHGVGDRRARPGPPPRPSSQDELPGAQADLDVDAGVAQVERVRVALAAVADDGDLAGEQVEVAFAVDRWP